MVRKLGLMVWPSALVLALSIPNLASAAREVDAKGVAGSVKCAVTGTTTIYAKHVDKIIFIVQPGVVLQPIDPADFNALNAIPRDTELDIKVIDNVNKVADLKGKVLSFLGAADTSVARQALRIVDVEYAMVCPLVP